MTTSASVSTTSLEKKLATEGADHVHKSNVRTSDLDVAAALVAGKEVTFTPEEALRIRCVRSAVRYCLRHTHSCDLALLCRRKIDLHLMPLMCSEYNTPWLLHRTRKR